MPIAARQAVISFAMGIPWELRSKQFANSIDAEDRDVRPWNPSPSPDRKAWEVTEMNCKDRASVSLSYFDEEALTRLTVKAV